MPSPLKINISRISEDTLSLSFDDTAKNLGIKLDKTDLNVLSPVKILIAIKKIGDKILVKGSLSASIEFVCSRCLTDFPNLVNENFSACYQRVDCAPPKELELDNDLISFMPLKADEIDLEEYIRESLILAAPIQPLCKKDCKGLCPDCGENRNVKDCGCKRKNIDPRLVKLKELL